MNSLYILDTDHIGILQRARGAEFERVVRRIESVGESAIYLTIISFHEEVTGWTKFVKGSLSQERIVTGYSKLETGAQSPNPK